MQQKNNVLINQLGQDIRTILSDVQSGFALDVSNYREWEYLKEESIKLMIETGVDFYEFPLLENINTLVNLRELMDNPHKEFARLVEVYNQRKMDDADLMNYIQKEVISGIEKIKNPTDMQTYMARQVPRAIFAEMKKNTNKFGVNMVGKFSIGFSISEESGGVRYLIKMNGGENE